MAWYKLDRRRAVLVDRGLQWRIILSVSIPMVSILVLVLGTQLVFDFLVRNGKLDVYGKVLGLPERAVSAVLFFVFATAYHTAHSLRMSQRIAGAAYRMRTVLKAFRDGDAGARIKLRDNDLHTELSREINTTLDWVSGEPGRSNAERRPPTGRTGTHAPAGTEAVAR